MSRDFTGISQQLRCVMKSRAWIAFFVLYAAILAWLWPKWASVHNGDDFGYYDNLANSIARATWTPSDWLEPFNRPLVWIGMGVYSLSGSFYFSSLGVSYVVALLLFVVVAALHRPQQESGYGEGALLAALLLLAPVALVDLLEYSAFSLCVLTAASAGYFWRQKQYLAFFAMAYVGLLCRQSQALLMVLPAIEILRNRRFFATGLAGIGCGVLLFFTCKAGAPETFAWKLAARKMTTEFHLTQWLGSAAFGLVWLLFMWAFWYFLTTGCYRKISGTDRSTLGWHSILPMLAAVIFAFGAAQMLWHVPGMKYIPNLFFYAVIIGAFLFTDWRALPIRDGMIFGCVYCLLVGFRGKWYGHYLLEPLVVMIALTSTMPPLARLPEKSLRLVQVGLLVVSITYGMVIERWWRQTEASVVKHEEALRAGKANLTALGAAPFGFKAWKLFPALKAEVRPVSHISDFLYYIKMPIPATARSSGVPAETWPLPAGFTSRVFPLNDREWTSYINTIRDEHNKH